MLNRDSEIVICSRFLSCELWSCDMNSTLGSVVPLAMFFLICMGIQSGGPFPRYSVLRDTLTAPFVKISLRDLRFTVSGLLRFTIPVLLILLSDLFLSSKLAIIYNLNISKIAYIYYRLLLFALPNCGCCTYILKLCFSDTFWCGVFKTSYRLVVMLSMALHLLVVFLPHTVTLWELTTVCRTGRTLFFLKQASRWVFFAPF